MVTLRFSARNFDWFLVARAIDVKKPLEVAYPDKAVNGEREKPTIREMM
jgi:hypothetical protein